MDMQVKPETPGAQNASQQSGYITVVTEPDVGLREFISILRRRIWYPVGIVGPLLLIAAIVLSQLTPRYTASAMILIEENVGRAMSIDAVVGGLSGDSETVQSEAYVLASQTLANRVIDKLNLSLDPEFNTNIDAGRPNSLSEEEVDSAIVAEFLDKLVVLPREGTRVIGIEFTSSRPQLAADITNLLAEEYLLSRIEAKFESTKRASAWLSDRIDELRTEVDETERGIETLRQEYGLLQGDGLTLSSRELVELNSQLVLARADRAQAEARLQQIRSLINQPGGVDTAQEVLDSALIQRLREQQAEVERRVAELSTELGDLHPRMMQLRAEADDLRDSIDLEISKIVAGLENQVSAARAREAALSRSVEAVKQTVAEANERDIEIRALEREAEANRQLLATLLSRQKETLSQEDIDFQQADARVISRAEVPIESSFPKVGMILLLVAFGGIAIAMLAILIVESLDRGFRSGEQIEAEAGVPSLGFIPRAPTTSGSAYDYFGEYPESAFGEAVRTLSWTMSLISPGEYPKVILVTSSTASEGKTTMATCLADALLGTGKKILLIDADMRKPNLHHQLKLDRDPGLAEHIANGVRVHKLTQESSGGLTVLTAGSATPNPTTLLGSNEFASMLDDAKRRYDTIIIDSPPVLAGADARLLAKLADATIFVVHWSKTRRETVRHCLKLLESAEATVSGALLTMVDTRKHRHYGYGDADTYTGEMEKYYVGQN